nr:10 kDa chaperonin-like [Ipomoea batatas]
MSWKRLVPTLNRVLVEKITAPAKTTSGILLPEKSSKLNSGKVCCGRPGLRDKAGNVVRVSFSLSSGRSEKRREGEGCGGRVKDSMAKDV